MEDLLLEQEQALSAPSAVARWTSQVSSFLTWNNFGLGYVTGKCSVLCHVAWPQLGNVPASHGHWGAGLLAAFCPKMWQRTSISALQCGGDHFPFFSILPLQVISGLSLSFMPVSKGKMKDDLLFLVMWAGHGWKNAKRRLSLIHIGLHSFSLQLGSHFKGRMLWLAPSFCTKVAKDFVH